MSRDLRGVLTTSDAVVPVAAQRVPRLIVLPFRLLRPDDAAEFLAFGLPDAITTSLSGLGSIVVRSTLVGGQYTTASPDLTALAEHAEVDLVLVGSLLRGGDRLQVNAQLLEVPAGTVVWAERAQVAWQDIFQLQDDLTRRIVASLAPTVKREGGAAPGPRRTGQRRRLRALSAREQARAHGVRVAGRARVVSAVC